MLHNRRWRIAQPAVIALMLVTALASVAQAEDAGQSQYSSSYSSSYQQVPGSAPSGNIIGYKPIPSSALEAAMSSPTGAPPQARQAYPSQPQAQAGITLGAVPVGIAAGGAPGAPSVPGQLPVTYQFGIVGEGFYTLGRDDVIQIEVRNQPEFSGVFAVGFDGRIPYSYLGDIPVAGLTKFEVQQVIEKLLVKYVRVPLVNVVIIGYNSKVVYVIGEVGNPGKFIMRGDAIKLREAILAAGLPSARAALSRVHVITPDLEHPTVRVINVKRILYQGQLKDDIDLTSGEIVVLPSTVLSAVNNFLNGLLSPVTRAARFAALATL